jgi:hypothetical protein
MQQLGSLLAECEMSIAIDFNHLNHCVRCYAHIINICSSHVISSMMSVSKQYLSELKVPINPSHTFHDDSDDESDDGNIDTEGNIDELELDGCYNDLGKPELKGWFAGIKRNPLKRACRIICLLRSSDKHREDFRKSIEDGNEQKWFSEKTQSGECLLVQVPKLELLRDVKTRWESVYKMLQCLRQLRPVSLSQRLDSVTAETN